MCMHHTYIIIAVQNTAQYNGIALWLLFGSVAVQELLAVDQSPGQVLGGL